MIGINWAHLEYIELLLNVGLVALITYVFIICLGTKEALNIYKKTWNAGHGFLFMLLVFSAFHGILESRITKMSSLDTFLLVWGSLLVTSWVPTSNQKI